MELEDFKKNLINTINKLKENVDYKNQSIDRSAWQLDWYENIKKVIENLK
jgi:hypothetical protein